MRTFTLVSVFMLLLPASFGSAGPSEGNPVSGNGVGTLRETVSLDFGWRFQRGEIPFGMGWTKARGFRGPAAPGYPDSTWRVVDVPHDFVVEGAFTRSAPGNNGFLPGDVAWYRKAFDIPSGDTGKRMFVEFDGVFRNSRIFLNGSFIGANLSGYTSFGFDVTDFIGYGGKNVLAVQVDARDHEGWFYEGGGIYRHVRLVMMHPLHVAPRGVFVRSDSERENDPRWADLHVRTTVENRLAADTQFTLTTEVLDPTGRRVASMDTRATMESWSDHEYSQTIRVARPVLWSIETPALYRLATTISIDGRQKIDRVETTFGIRTIRFDADRGFFLNGKPVKIKGVCCHQDHAGVGAALPDRIHEFRIEKLKEMGCNAYRTSHNPPAPEILDACDRLGMLVMDENRIMESSAEVLSQLESLVRRDRNHPSVIMWSIGNEENAIQGTEQGERVAFTMMRRIKQLDPSRPVTMAENASNERGVSRVVDIKGFNYNQESYDRYHAANPRQPIVVSESASTVGTRGIYENDPSRGYVPAYGIQHPKVGWGLSAEDMWKGVAGRDYLMGCFVWTGFDYRGEPTPYSWPCINSHFWSHGHLRVPEGHLLVLQGVVERRTRSPHLSTLELVREGGRAGRGLVLFKLRPGRAVPERQEPGKERHGGVVPC